MDKEAKALELAAQWAQKVIAVDSEESALKAVELTRKLYAALLMEKEEKPAQSRPPPDFEALSKLTQEGFQPKRFP